MTTKTPTKGLATVGIVTLLSVITGLAAAVLGSEGLPGLISALSGSGASEIEGSKPQVSIGSESPVTGGIVVGEGNVHLGEGATVGSGSCNNIKASGDGVTIICSPSSSGLPSGIPGFDTVPELGQADTPVQIQAVVEGLRRAGNTFTLRLENGTSHQSLNIPINLDISDDLGNTYELDRLAMHGEGLSKRLPPGRKIKVDYVLQSPIDPNAGEVIFTLDHVWAQTAGSQFKTPLPFIEFSQTL